MKNNVKNNSNSSKSGNKLAKKLGLGGALAAAAVIAASVYAGSPAQADDSSRRIIADNIYIGDIAVGGMTEVEANEAVNDYIDSLADKQFTLTVDDKSVVATARDFGLNWTNTIIVKDALDVGKAGNLIERYKSKKDLEHENLVYDIEYSADINKVKSYLAANTSDMNQEAINCGLVRENGGFTITDGQNGIAVDIDKSAEEIVSFIEEKWEKQNTTMELAAKVVEPEGSRSQLERVHDLIGSYTTDFSSSAAGRAQNVRNGASKINGTLLYPGQQFSVYEAVNPFSAENGYELAGSYENGTTVQTYGGGICQVSTTLYNAVIRAELAIDERYCHSMIVSYVQPSMDAAISGTYKDLKFTNNYDFPIYIEGYTSGGLITFNVFGEETRDSNREVIFESETVSTTEPETKFVASGDHAIGYVNRDQGSHTGYVARLWKIVKVNGAEVSRDVYNNSTYNASPKIITVGVKSDDPEAVAAIKAAIASGDENKVREAAAANSSAALEEQKKKEEEEKKKLEEEQKTQGEGADKENGKDKDNDKNKDKDEKPAEKPAEPTVPEEPDQETIIEIEG